MKYVLLTSKLANGDIGYIYLDHAWALDLTIIVFFCFVCVVFLFMGHVVYIFDFVFVEY